MSFPFAFAWLNASHAVRHSHNWYWCLERSWSGRERSQTSPRQWITSVGFFFFPNSSSSSMDGRKLCPIRRTAYNHFVCTIWKFPKEQARQIFGIGWLYLRSWGNTSIWNVTLTTTSNCCTWVWKHVCVNQLLLFLWITLTFILYFA
jgi:hypothetical protein